MEKWMELLVSWLPFAVLTGLWFWFARSNGMQARASSGATLIEPAPSRSRRTGR